MITDIWTKIFGQKTPPGQTFTQEPESSDYDYTKLPPSQRPRTVRDVAKARKAERKARVHDFIQQGLAQKTGEKT